MKTSWVLGAVLGIILLASAGGCASSTGATRREAKSGAAAAPQTSGVTSGWGSRSPSMGGLPACDRVEVFLLGGVSERPQRGQFPIVPYKTTSGIEGMRILRGPDAEALTALWRGLDFDPSKRAMCHEPHYGLRFYGGGKLRLQTSVCWGCRNFYVEDRWEGFDAKSESGQRLLRRLRQILPDELPHDSQ